MPRLTAPARRALVRERRQQILAAAATVFAEKGFDRATISDVARAAGVSDGSIYNYFRDKQDLLVHLPRQFMQTPIEAVQAAIAKPGTPLAAENVLQFAAQNIVNLIIQNREIARVLFTTIPFMDDKLRAEYMRQVPLYAFETLEGFIKAQQAAGVFRADLDPAIAARIFPGMLLAFLLIQEILQPPDMHRFEYDQIIYTVVQVFLRGVTVPEKAAPDIAPKPHTKAKSTPRQARKQEITVE